MRQLVLVGLMGSGKSTVGALVAAQTGRTFVDVDVVITAETGKTVRELWEEGGEKAYRSLESETVLRVLADDTPTVLAAPAGVVLDPVVRAALASHLTVWLRTDPATLAGRVHVGDHRPLLGDHPAETLAAMAVQRAELYRDVATATIDTDGRTPAAIADLILGLLAEQPPEPA
jgi:shikimate kinase